MAQWATTMVMQIWAFIYSEIKKKNKKKLSKLSTQAENANNTALESKSFRLFHVMSRNILAEFTNSYILFQNGSTILKWFNWFNLF